MPGLRRTRAQGTPLRRRQNPCCEQAEGCAGLSHSAAAAQLGVSEATMNRWRLAERLRGSEPLLPRD